VNATVNIAVTSEQFLKEHPQALEKYIKSMDEIYQFIQANPQRSAEIVYTAHGAPVAQTLGMLNLVNTTIDFDQDFYDAMENVLEWGKGRGIIRYPYELKDYVDLTALKAVFPGRGNFN
jgi:NitT/TauT family transport system substrate-binding protein